MRTQFPQRSFTRYAAACVLRCPYRPLPLSPLPTPNRPLPLSPLPTPKRPPLLTSPPLLQRTRHPPTYACTIATRRLLDPPDISLQSFGRSILCVTRSSSSFTNSAQSSFRHPLVALLSSMPSLFQSGRVQSLYPCPSANRTGGPASPGSLHMLKRHPSGEMAEPPDWPGPDTPPLSQPSIGYPQQIPKASL